MKIQTIMLYTVALTLGGCSAYNGAYRNKPDHSMQERMAIESYNKYELREPCQKYRVAPPQYVGNCTKEMSVKDSVIPEPYHNKIIRSYTVLFDFDKAGIRKSEYATLDQAMNEIKQYDPQQVTVTGYTDSHGEADYNQALSREREQTVSKALLSRGIASQTLKREARGEYSQSVTTPDGVRNQANRRVVIDFRR